MRNLIPIALIAALAVPAAAQEPSDGMGLIQEGADRLLQGLIDEARPALEDLAGIGAEMLPTFRLIAQEMGPAFVDIFSQVDSIANYDPPVFLPNGDIVLRRHDDAPAWTPPRPTLDATPTPDVTPAPRPTPRTNDEIEL